MATTPMQRTQAHNRYSNPALVLLISKISKISLIGNWGMLRIDLCVVAILLLVGQQRAAGCP